MVVKKQGVLCVAFVAALLAGLVLVPAGLAARGGKGKPGGGATPTATLYSSCNPCTAGTLASFWGSGYDGSQGRATLYVSGTWSAVPVAPDGTVSFAWNLRAVGTYEFKLYQTGNGGKLVLKSRLAVVSQ